MINAERIFRENFVNFLAQNELTGTPYYSTCSWASIEDYLRYLMDGMNQDIRNFDVNVAPHRSKNNVASFNTRYPHTINLNSKRMNVGDFPIAGRIAHEFTHLANYHVKSDSFSHPSLRFWRKRKVKNSAPYLIGYGFKKYLWETR